jgi:serine/threonine-protein kinase
VTNPSKIGRYEIIERVGRGGMGAVYRGRDTILDREVAIKVMSSDFAADETSRPRFYREARAAAKLQHRNIVTIFEFGEEDETPFIVMEFLRGQDLSKRMRTEPPLTLEEKIEVIAELCTGLHFAHEQGVIHRDVKPANIWLVPDGSVKLLDFGIAKFASSTMTKQGSVFGSISYMSPEQVTGGEVDGRADVFSAGVVLYELLTGKKPFAGDSPTAVLARIMDDEPAPLQDLSPEIPRPLIAALAKALQKDREKRYRHAADFGADLRLVRSAIAASTDAIAAEVDFAETMLSDQKPKSGDISANQPAGQFVVSRTASLPMPEPAAEILPKTGGRTWLVPVLAVLLVLAAAGGYLVFGRGPSTSDAGEKSTVAAAQVALKIESEPAGVSIVVDNVDTGRVTPAEITVGPGRLPTIRLARAGKPLVEDRVTAADVRAGRWYRRVAAEPARQPVQTPQNPPAESRTTVIARGSYPFEVVDERGRTVSASSDAHQFSVAGRRTLRLVNQDHFLDKAVTVDGSGRPVNVEAPGLGTLDLRSPFETCRVIISGRDLGEPPVTVQLAEGGYTAQMSCPDGQTRRASFRIAAGQKQAVRIQ